MRVWKNAGWFRRHSRHYSPHTKTYIPRLLTNYFSFTSRSYKLGLIRTLVDRAYKINNTWLGFHEDITKLTKILQKNLFPVHLVENTINHYLTLTRQDCNPPASVSDTTRTFYFKLPYIGPFSIIAQKKVRHFAKRYCNNIDIKLVFSSFKIGNLFSVKDPIPRGLRAGVGVIGPHTFLSTYKILNFAALYALLTVSAS